MNLRAYREREGKSLYDAAAHTGLTAGYLSKIERGLMWPGAHVLAILAKWTGGLVTPNDVFKSLDMALFAAKPVRVGKRRGASKGPIRTEALSNGKSEKKRKGARQAR